MAERYLQFVRNNDGFIGRRINVTNRSEREIERIERGMLINIGDGWHVADTQEEADAPPPENPD